MKYLDFSNNAIEDKGAMALAKWIAGKSVGLVHLNIKNCGITKKGKKKNSWDFSLKKKGERLFLKLWNIMKHIIAL